MAAVMATLVIVPSALATISACPATNTALSTIDGIGNGCTTVNATYSNFIVSTSVATSINGVTLNPGGIYTVLNIPDTAIVVAVGSHNELLLNAFGPAASDPFCGPTSGDRGWCVNAPTLQTTLSQITYTAQYNTNLTTLGVSIRAISHSSGQTDGAAVAFREFCLGFANFSDSSTCNVGGTNYRVVQAGVLSGQNLDQTFLSSIGFSNQSLFAIRDTIYVHNSGANGSYAAILNFDSIDSPEPATFGLMGTALGALALLAKRRRN